MYVHCCFFTVLCWAKQSTRSLLVGSKLLESVHWDILLGWHSCHVSVELIWLGAQGGLQRPTPVWIPWKTHNCEMRMRKKKLKYMYYHHCFKKDSCTCGRILGLCGLQFDGFPGNADQK